jgi:hypothetical protein
MMGLPHRQFSYMHSSQQDSSKYKSRFLDDDQMAEYMQRIESNQTDRLVKLQKEYEKNQDNYDAVLAYFKELNRHGKFLTVLREFKSREIAFSTSYNKTQISEQYDYAFENIEHLKRSLTELNNIKQGNTSSKRPLFSRKAIEEIIKKFLYSAIMWYCFYYLFNML